VADLILSVGLMLMGWLGWFVVEESEWRTFGLGCSARWRKR
jgi:hypothetical protein